MGDPAVDLLDLDPCVNLSRDERKPEADECTLDDGITQEHVLGEEGGTDKEIDTNRADDDCIVRVSFAHILILSIFVSVA